MSSWPVSAGPLLPDTGASTNSTSGRILASRAPASIVASTPIVPICTQTAPSVNPSTTPPLRTTESTTAAVGSMVITTLASRTASRADGAASAPASVSGAVACGDRSHTVVRIPAPTSLRAIADPIMPIPSTATVFSVIVFLLSV